jgi:hypothetical protein
MKANIFKWLVPAVLLALVMTCSAYAQSSTSFSIKWSSTNSAGALGLSSASFKLNGTLGQSVAGNAASASFRAYLGFWVPQASTVAIGSLDEAKGLVDGSAVSIAGKIATTDLGDFAGFFYIEEPDRSSGIRVVSSSVTGILARGKTVSLEGTLATTSAGERQIVGASVTVGSDPTSLIGAAAMNNRTLGGGNFGDPAIGQGQYGVVGGSGTNNVGLLIRTSGRVTGSGSGYATVDDGSGVTIRVDTTGLASQPTGYAVLTGISSLNGTAGSATRLVLAID